MANGTFNCEVIFSSNKASVQNIVNTLQKEVDKIDLGSKAGQQVLKRLEKIKQKQSEMGLYEDNASNLSTSEISKYLSLTKSLSTEINTLVNSFSGLTIGNGLKVPQATLDSLKEYDARIKEISDNLKKLGKNGALSATVGALDSKELRDHFSGGKQSPYSNNTKQTSLEVALQRAQQQAKDLRAQQEAAKRQVKFNQESITKLEAQKAALPSADSLQVQSKQGQANLQKFLDQAVAQRNENAEKTKQAEEWKTMAQSLPDLAKQAAAKVTKTATPQAPVQQKEVVAVAAKVAEATATATVAAQKEQDWIKREKSYDEFFGQADDAALEAAKAEIDNSLSEQLSQPVGNRDNLEVPSPKKKAKKKQEIKVKEAVVETPSEPTVELPMPELEVPQETSQAISQAAAEALEQEYQMCFDLLTDSKTGILNAKGALNKKGQRTKSDLREALQTLDFDADITEKIVNSTTEKRFDLIRQGVAQKLAKQNEELAAQAEASTTEAAIKKQQKDAAKAYIQTEFSDEEWRRIFNAKGAYQQNVVNDENIKQRVKQGMANLGLDELQVSEIMERSAPGNALQNLFEKMFANPEQYAQYFKDQIASRVGERNAQEQSLTAQIDQLNADITQKMAEADSLGQQAQVSETDAATLTAEIAKIREKQESLQQQLDQLKAERAQVKDGIDTPQGGSISQDAFKNSQGVQADVREMFQKKQKELAEEKVKTEAELEVEQFQNNLSSGLKQWMGLTQVINIVRNGIREAYEDIKNLDQSMTNIAVVTDMSVDDLWGKIDEYMAVAQQYGVTTQGVYEVSQLFYQQGLGAADTMELTTETLKMARQ